MKDLNTYSKAFLADLNKEFHERMTPIDMDTIEKLSVNDYAISNVVRGLQNESFSVELLSEANGDEYSYRLIYVTFKGNSLQGAILNLNPLLSKRNELTIAFTAYLCNFLGVKDNYKAFNTFQTQQQTLLEQIGFWTYSDKFFKDMKHERFSILFKSNLPPLYIPFGNKYKDRLNSDKNFVYVMHNRQNNYFKIGRSIYPTYRETTLQALEPDVILVEKWRASHDVEKYLHKKYSAKRKRGEWFSLDENDLEEIRGLMKEYELSVGLNGK